MMGYGDSSYTRGSMGNLCLPEIKDKFEQRVSTWDIATVREAVRGLLGNRL